MTDTRILIDRYYRFNDADAASALRASHSSPLQALLAIGQERLAEAHISANVDIEATRTRWQALMAEHREMRETELADIEANRPALGAPMSERDIWVRRAKAFNSSSKSARELYEGRTPETIATLTRLADAYAAVIRSARDTGGNALVCDGSHPGRVEAVAAGMQVLPTWWIQTAFESSGRLAVVATRGSEYSAYQDTGSVTSTVAAAPAQVWNDEPDDDFFGSVSTLDDGTFLVQEYEWNKSKRQPGPDWVPNDKAGSVPRQFGGRWLSQAVRPGVGWMRPARAELEAPALILSTERPVVAGRPDGFGVALHEMGHWLEQHVPGIAAACHEWLDSRTSGDDTRLSASARVRIRGAVWADEYIGRRYDGDATGEATEVLSCGLEAMFAGLRGGLIGCANETRPDDEMRALILGLLATIGVAEHSSQSEFDAPEAKR